MTPAQPLPLQQIPLQRFHDWPELLHAWLRAVQTWPFAWGQHDCAAFAAQAVLVQTGICPRWPTWRTRREAVAALRAEGGLLPAVHRLLPALPSPLHAWRGDVLCIQGPAWRHLAVCTGVGWAAPTRQGLLTVNNLHHATHAWAVGHAPPQGVSHG
jgi:hypothetical protein